VAVAVGAYLVAAHAGPRTSPAATRTPPPARATGARPAGSTTAPLAPNGAFTTQSGASATVASLRGKPTLVWFVAGGCASCAASIPVVAAHLGQLTGRGVQVLTLGLYGAFPDGKDGVRQLLSFGRAAAGGSITRPGWRWGMASESLSMAYDPSGTPDVYALIGADGHIRYRNSVPESTMPQLIRVIAAAAEAAGLVVLHYDGDFELIAEVTGQPVESVVPAGAVP
jgi:hypothetical protein